LFDVNTPRLYNGRYVGTCSLESTHQFIFLSLPTLFLFLHLPHSFFSSAIVVLKQRERKREWDFELFTTTMEVSTKWFLNVCFLLLLFVLFVEQQTIASPQISQLRYLIISMFLFCLFWFFLSFSLFLCLKQNNSVFLVEIFCHKLHCVLNETHFSLLKKILNKTIFQPNKCVSC
jgi:hypothetical protein